MNRHSYFEVLYLCSGSAEYHIQDRLLPFLDCLETGRPFETEAREYMEKTFAVVEAAYRSIDSHRCVEISEIMAPMQ